MYKIFLLYIILIIGTINIIRIGIFMIGADFYAIKEAKRTKKLKKLRTILPTFSVLIPAHNESATIINCVKSVVEAEYPQNKLEILVIDDGSTDDTAKLVQEYVKSKKIKNIEIISRTNTGKAGALNYALANVATGELVMCLDADSSIDCHALKESAYYFLDKKVVAMSANIKIRSTNSLLNSIQKYEYIIGHQLKRAQSIFNIEYVVGGVGSVFRRKRLTEVNFYDSDTLTEDLDLTMKLVGKGNKEWKVIFGAKVIAYTESVMSISELITQRYRWKFGFAQTLFKNRYLFFNKDRKYNKLLTWIYLPYLVYSLVVFVLEPIILSFFLYNILRYQDVLTLFYGIVFMAGYLIINVLLESTLTRKERIKLAFLAPSMYIFFYILSFVEYSALVKGLLNLRNLKASIGTKHTTWQHVERPKIA